MDENHTSYVAFLRGINVGGHRKIPMADLRRLFVGKTSDPTVRTYIASGNVVFRGQGTKEDLTGLLQDGIKGAFGFDVPVLLLSADEIGAVLAGCPCAAEKGNLAHAYLCFAPPQLDKAAIAVLREPSETVTVVGRTVWLHAPDGVGRSKLAAKLERLIGVEATARNLNTVRKMVEMVGE
jgi:uncharacterized protein (DUF1697 family)